MYYTGLDPRTMTPVYVPKDPHEKDMQRALIQYRNPKNYHLVKEALIKAGREDLIGFGSQCLIPPRPLAGSKNADGRKNMAGSRTKAGGRNAGKNTSNRKEMHHEKSRHRHK